jgi:hypothetical protein
MDLGEDYVIWCLIVLTSNSLVHSQTVVPLIADLHYASTQWEFLIATLDIMLMVIYLLQFTITHSGG